MAPLNTRHEQTCYFIIETVMGWVGVSRSAAGLRRSTLPNASLDGARRELALDRNCPENPEPFRDLAGRLAAYFRGQKVIFPDDLDLADATAFRRQVWELVKRIPYGEVRSYSSLALETGKAGACRAVGQALSRNPLPIIVPCHRVLGAGGQLVGFRGGTEMKKRLLRLENGPLA